MNRPIHFLAELCEERQTRDRYEAEKARRQREYEQLPRHSQAMLLTHLAENPDQRTLFEEEP